MKFKYKKHPLDKPNPVLGKYLLKPVIPIKVSIDNGVPIFYEALIDSGADFCIFDMEIGRALGAKIDKARCAEFGGINPSDPKKPPIAYFVQVKLDVGGWDVITEVGFSEDISKYGFGILGHKGFFEYYKVTFDLLKEVVELKPRF